MATKGPDRGELSGFGPAGNSLGVDAEEGGNF